MKKYINATIYGQPESHEFIVENGQFKEIGNQLSNVEEVIDLEGRLVLPPYVDPHLHLDYIFSGLGPVHYLKGSNVGVIIRNH